MNIFNEASKLAKENIPFAIATIISAKGSTPRNIAKMIVKEDGNIINTIGGGLAEAYVIRDSIKAIKAKQSRTVEYKLNNDVRGGIQMYCGGELTVFIEVMTMRPRLLIIGGGHVGHALSKFANMLDYEISVVDDREEFANKNRFPMAIYTSADEDIEKAIDRINIDKKTYIVIMTKDSDEKALKKVINSDAAYIGMIGSRRKVTILKENLLNENVSKERLDFIHSPIGLDIGSETPEEIAMSILAEIMKVKSERTGLSFKELMEDEK